MNTLTLSSSLSLSDQAFKSRFDRLAELSSGFNLKTLHSHDTWRSMLREVGRLGEIALRDRHIKEIGFPILTREVISCLTRALLGKRVVDVGCGSGFLASQLQSFGCNVVAVDTFETCYTNADFSKVKFCEILQTDATELDYANFDVVIMTWPDHTTQVSDSVANNMKIGQYLIYQGEGDYGCTGSAAFHQMLHDNFKKYSYLERRLNMNHVQFASMHDDWTVYRKIRQ